MQTDRVQETSIDLERTHESVVRSQMAVPIQGKRKMVNEMNAWNPLQFHPQYGVEDINCLKSLFHGDPRRSAIKQTRGHDHQ